MSNACGCGVERRYHRGHCPAQPPTSIATGPCGWCGDGLGCLCGHHPDRCFYCREFFTTDTLSVVVWGDLRAHQTCQGKREAGA